MHIRFQDARLKQIEEEYEFWKRLASKAINCSEFIIDGKGVQISFPIGLPNRAGGHVTEARLIMKNIHFNAPNHIVDFNCPVAFGLVFVDCRFAAEQLIATGRECNERRKMAKNCHQISFQNLNIDSLRQLGKSKIITDVNEDAMWHGSLALGFESCDVEIGDQTLVRRGIEKLLSLFRGAESLFFRSEERKELSLSFPPHPFKNLRHLSAYGFVVEDSLLTSLSDHKKDLFPSLSLIDFEWCCFRLAEDWNFDIEKIEYDNGIFRIKKKQDGFGGKWNKKRLLQQEDLELELEPEVEQEFEHRSLRCLVIENLTSAQSEHRFRSFIADDESFIMSCGENGSEANDMFDL